MNNHQKQTITLKVYDPLGALDTDVVASPITVTSEDPNVASVSLGADGRSMTIMGVGVGTTTVTVDVGGTKSPQSNAIVVAIVAAPDSRHLDFTLGQIVAQ